MTPLIFTTKGNIPIAGLDHEVDWRVTPEQITFVERYLQAGEVVKESTHIHILTGVSMLGDAEGNKE